MNIFVIFIVLLHLSIGNIGALSKPNNGALQVELDNYKHRSRILLTMLYDECPGEMIVRKREVVENSNRLLTMIDSERKLYKELVTKLTNCRHLKKNNINTTTTTTKLSKTTSTPIILPIKECLSAVNLTEAWRRDYNGSGIRPIRNRYKCDLGSMIASGRPWFRFAGEAGERLLNTCPPQSSCGTAFPLWSNSVMPSQIGIATDIQLYASYSGSCAEWTYKATVIKCSDSQHDFVYRYDSPDRTCSGFCGMM